MQSQPRVAGSVWPLSILLWSAFAADAGAAAPLHGRCDLGSRLRVEIDESCGAARVAVRVDHRARSTQRELFVEAEQLEEGGPAVSYRLGRIRPSRPIRRTLYELRAAFEASSPTPGGDLRSAFGFKAQLENPPRRPGERATAFQRNGRQVLVERATLSYAGVTAGLAPSIYNFTPTLGYSTPYATEQVVGLIAYSRHAAGVTATLAVEEQRRRRVAESAWGTYGKGTSADLVATVRNSQPWGVVQASAALHPVRGVAPSAVTTDRATGWAAGLGYEHWFETAGASHGIVVNGSVSRGALDYLGLGNFPADLAVTANGALALNAGRSVVVSYSRSWSHTLQSAVTASAYSTSLGAPGFEWRTRGMLLQATTDWALAPGLHVGVELNRHADSVQGGRSDGPRQALGNRYYSGVLYARLRY